MLHNQYFEAIFRYFFSRMNLLNANVPFKAVFRHTKQAPSEIMLIIELYQQTILSKTVMKKICF